MEVKKYEIEEVIEKLQLIVEEMEAYGVEEVPTNCNTYRLYKFISFGSKGYLDLETMPIFEEEEY